MIGHPMGLPLKVASGARVRRVDSSKRFVANLDAYRANSGSPVLSWDEDLGLRVEGILVSGERDFKLAETGEGCQISRVCPDEECLGETVVNIAAVR